MKNIKMSGNYDTDVDTVLNEVKKYLISNGCKFTTIAFEDLKISDVSDRIISKHYSKFRDEDHLLKVLHVRNTKGYVVDVSIDGVLSYTITITNKFRATDNYSHQPEPPKTSSVNVAFCTVGGNYQSYFTSKERTNKYPIKRINTRSSCTNINTKIAKYLCSKPGDSYGTLWHYNIVIGNKLSPTRIINTILEYNRYVSYTDTVNKLTSDKYKNNIKFKLISAFSDLLDNELGEDSEYNLDVEIGDYQEGVFNVTMNFDFDKDGAKQIYTLKTNYVYKEDAIYTLSFVKLDDLSSLNNVELDYKTLVKQCKNFSELQTNKEKLILSIVNNTKHFHHSNPRDGSFSFQVIESIKCRIPNVTQSTLVTGIASLTDIITDDKNTVSFTARLNQRLGYRMWASGKTLVDDIPKLDFNTLF